jgi:S-adenosylmethionine-diacylglycerol 3-amino-3-carboxypropyl transferase
VHGGNLSDIFEYMSLDEYRRSLDRLCRALAPGGRLAYWNMLAPRRRPDDMAAALRPLPDLATRLHAEDKAFFYSAFVVEERV